MNEEEILQELRDKIAEQGVQLILFCGLDIELRVAMAGFMKDVMNTFLDFKTDQRKLILKFMIETDQFILDLEKKAKECDEQSST